MRTARILSALVVLLYPIAAGTLLLTSNGWAVNRANVFVWAHLLGPVGLLGAITPDRFGDLMNIVLFMPFFAALTVLIPTWWWVAAGFLISSAVELYQTTLPARQATIVDVITNTLGAALGVWAGFGIRRLVRRAGERATRAAGPTTAPAPSAAAPNSPRGAPGTGPADPASRGASDPTTPSAAPPRSGHGPGGAPDDRG